MNKLKQTVRTSITVYETTDYDMFHHIDGNRNIDYKHVEELAEKIKRDGQEVLALITPDYGIYDGQHRIEACKLLGIPVKWMFTDKEKTPENVSNLNGLQKPWSERDYLESLEKRGSVPAKRLLRVMDEFHLSRRLIVYAAGRDSWTMDYKKLLKEEKTKGKYDPFNDQSFSEQNMKTAQNRLKYISKLLRVLRRYGKIHNEKKLIEAFISVDKAEGFSRKRLEDVLERNGDKLPVSCSSIGPIIQRIAVLYNANKKGNFMDIEFASGGKIKKITCTATTNRWTQM